MTQNLGNLFIDGESIIEDETGTHTISTVGAVVSTDQKKFLNSSIYFNGASHLSIATHNDWEIIAGNFTIDLWVKHTDHTGREFYISQYSNDSNSWFLEHDPAQGGLHFGNYASDTYIVSTPYAGEITDTNWHHVALVKNGNVYTIYKDGVYVTSTEDSSIDSYTGPLFIGAHGSNVFNFDGYMDNIRIVKGTALWTDNFNVNDTDAMFYTPVPVEPEVNPYVRPDTITGLYHIVNRVRGKAKEGFIRPTIREMFKSEKDFIEIPSAIPVEATGGTITNIDGYRVHTFTEDGTFEITSGDSTVECLVIAGGGGGGGLTGGGGGAGGLVYNPTFSLSKQAYPITIGNGGIGGIGYTGGATWGSNGEDSTFSTITANGGGGGGGYNNSAGAGRNGGCGGGGCGQLNSTNGIGTQGYDGGANPTTGTYGAGGGGSGSVGGDGAYGDIPGGGIGGDGQVIDITGTSVKYAGGGGGSFNIDTASLGFGGGNGSNLPGGTGQAGTNSKGGGGGAGGGNNDSATGGIGGSGVVIIRYAV